MLRVLKDPLTHFVVAGLGLFLLYQAVGPVAVETAEPKVVVVDRASLLTFIQYRTRAFDQDLAAARLDVMAEAERDALIDDYVREEVLYREALALGLDAGDYILRRRLVQKLEFVAQGFAEAGLQLDDVALQRQFDQNKDEYYVAPSITFTHVFLDAERRGWEAAQSLAKTTLAVLNGSAVPFSAAPGFGDRFPYHVNYVERTHDYVVGHFGPELTSSVFELKAGEGWHGPYASPFGLHLVQVSRNIPGRYPQLDEIRGRVEADARRSRIRDRSEDAINEIVATYKVRVDLGTAAQ